MSKLIILSGIPGSGKTTYALGIKNILPRVAIFQVMKFAKMWPETRQMARKRHMFGKSWKARRRS
jgi:tRNA uridine 5-carbamoylmethylation protein Kti12